MTQVLLSIGLVAIFILTGALFAATEMALVSLREGQVRAFSERGGRSARVARLSQHPNRFLATVQIGVTLAGFMSAAFGEATLASRLDRVFVGRGLPASLANVAATIVITLIISYFAIVFGELVPKRVALQRVEGVALGLGPPLDRVATGLRPFIWLLSKSTDVIVRLLGVDPGAKRDEITQEELRDMVAAHESLSREERTLIAEVFQAGKRQIREVMIPRTEVDFLDASLRLTQAVDVVAASPHSRFPVERGSHDQIVGFVHVRDILSRSAAGAAAVTVGQLARQVSMLPDSRTVLDAMSDLRRSEQHIAVVVDEYGGTAGIVTLEDLIEELIGDIQDEYDSSRSTAKQLSGGDVEVDGLLNLDEFEEATGRTLPDGPYETAAGYILRTLGRLPGVGDVVSADGCRLTVTELDGRRIARVRVSPIPADDEPADNQPADNQPADNQPAGDQPAVPAAAGTGSVPLDS
ncbi:MAG: hemolysin family protein [Frankiaceae bacterium]